MDERGIPQGMNDDKVGYTAKPEEEEEIVRREAKGAAENMEQP